MRELSLFGLNTSRDYADRVAAHLHIELCAHEERAFEDGEHKSRALVDVAGHDVFVIHSLYSESAGNIDGLSVSDKYGVNDTHSVNDKHGVNDKQSANNKHSVNDKQSANDKLCRLLFFIGSLKDAGAARVSAVMPYLCYARKDQRTQPRDPITTRYVAAMFEAVGTDRVATIDVHNLAAFENAFRCHADNLKAKPLFVDYFRECAQREACVVVAPDFGGAKRAEDFRRDLAAASSSDIAVAVMEKYRGGGVVSGSALVGDVRGKTAIILDDLISSGGTLRRAAHACRDAGATQVHAAATHGLFMSGSADMLSDPAFDSIAITDSVPPLRIAAQKYTGHLRIIDSTPLIADAIARWHRECD